MNISCTVKDAIKLMSHLQDDDMVILTIIENKKNKKRHDEKRIKKKNGEVLFEKAKAIEYQNNDFFGRFSLYGVSSEEIIHNILFPQLE